MVRPPKELSVRGCHSDWRRPASLALLLLVILSQGCGGGGGSPNAPSPPPSVSSVVVTGWLSALAVGQSVQLSATAIRADGSTRSVTIEAAWQTSNVTVAIVSPVGLVTALRTGQVNIRASYQGQTGSLGLAVEGTEPPPGPMPGLACGVERWNVKTLSDVDASRVDLSRVQMTSIKALNERTSHCNGGPERRSYSEEFEAYEVVGRITHVAPQDDRDYHVVVADPSDPAYTIVTEVADIACQGAIISPHRGALEAARNAFVALLGSRSTSSLVGTSVRVRGVGFYDFNHGQIGRARNCMELHPILAIEALQ
jgi:Bacterial Ig-like domain (group 2)